MDVFVDFPGAVALTTSRPVLRIFAKIIWKMSSIAPIVAGGPMTVAYQAKTNKWSPKGEK